MHALTGCYLLHAAWWNANIRVCARSFVSNVDVVFVAARRMSIVVHLDFAVTTYISIECMRVCHFLRPEFSISVMSHQCADCHHWFSSIRKKPHTHPQWWCNGCRLDRTTDDSCSSQSEHRQPSPIFEESSQHHRISLPQRYSIITLHLLNYDDENIASIVNCDIKTVRRWIQHFNRVGEFSEEAVTEFAREGNTIYSHTHPPVQPHILVFDSV